MGKPLLVAIVGGSGSGKTLLASRLQGAFRRRTTRLSMDDFYLDRSHLPLPRRAALNFDHPRALDWAKLQSALESLLAGCSVLVPAYDFETHSRKTGWKRLRPAPIILMDGLWILRRRSLRRLISFSIFISCPAATRLKRRLTRDLRSRGRTRQSVKHQFWSMVEPMHQQYVEPQSRKADLILGREWSEREVLQIVRRLQA